MTPGEFKYLVIWQETDDINLGPICDELKPLQDWVKSALLDFHKITTIPDWVEHKVADNYGNVIDGLLTWTLDVPGHSIRIEMVEYWG